MAERAANELKEIRSIEFFSLHKLTYERLTEFWTGLCIRMPGCVSKLPEGNGSRSDHQVKPDPDPDLTVNYPDLTVKKALIFGSDLQVKPDPDPDLTVK